MNAREFEEAIYFWEENNDYAHGLAFDGLAWNNNTAFIKPVVIKTDVVYAQIVDYNVEAEKESCTGEIYVIFKVSHAGGVQFFKKTGRNTSHVGSEWFPGFKEVIPNTTTTTVYTEK